MKKIILILSILSIFINCTRSSHNDNSIIEIRERMFLGQVNEIYLNPSDYLGKTLKIEGLFMRGDSGENADPFYAVYRFGPGGCCGTDGIVGFEVAWPSGLLKEYPKNDSWVEAVGELKNNDFYLYIDLASLTVKEKRGNINVTQ